ncbi:unnamed protein product [Strongylus vulgaris]|uniref:Uncharacterized protein n=1 Tax=Strongylus vulgaris TaxID=40348 RepID=A0A3P7JWA6_STRVU|nr:unnamed protein product [Strongylus vulgaris]
MSQRHRVCHYRGIDGEITVRQQHYDSFLVTNLKLNNSLVTVIEGNIADIIRGMPNYASKGFTIEGNVGLTILH